MCRCTQCGRFYVHTTGRPVNKAMVAQGPAIQTEFPEGICGNCRGPGQDVALVYIGDDDLYGQYAMEEL